MDFRDIYFDSLKIAVRVDLYDLFTKLLKFFYYVGWYYLVIDSYSMITQSNAGGY